VSKGIKVLRGVGHVHAIVLVVLVVAAAVRLAALLDGRDAPTFDFPIIDARTYDLAARSLADGNGLDYRFFWQPFFYPVFLGLSHMLSGGSVFIAKLVQVTVGVATCGLTARVGQRLLGPGAGLAAGLICALHGPMIFFETELLATGWASFWAILLLDRLVDPARQENARAWFVTGLITALAVLTRPTFLPALLLAAAWLLWRAPAALRLKGALVAALGFALLVAPVALLGQVTVGYPGFLPASGAMNLYLGNHSEPCETLTIRPGAAWDELGRRAQPAGAGDLHANREYFREQLVQEVAANPGAVASGLLRKGVQLLSSRELPRNVDPYVQREWSGLLGVLMFKVGNFGFPSGLLLPLALLGAFTMRRRVGAALLIFTGVYLLSVGLVFVSARYRVPMTPALAILAVAGAMSLAQAWRDRHWHALAAMAGLLLLTGAVGSVPGRFCEEEIDYRAETLYAVGYAQHEAGDLEAAARNYAIALEHDASNVERLNQYALLRSQQGRAKEADALWSRALRQDPQSLTIRLNLGRSYAAREQHAQAFEHYEAALGLDAGNADALLGTGFALLGMGRLDEGVPRLEAAVERHRAYARRLPPVIDALQSVGREDLAERLRTALNRAGGR